MEDFGWFGDENLMETPEPYWMDDFYQYNQNEADDYRSESEDYEPDYDEYDELEAEDAHLDAQYESQFEEPQWADF